VTQRKNVSDATAKIIDDEIRRIIDHSEGRARDILTGNMDALHRLAKALLEYETISGDEVRALIRGESIARDTPDDAPTPTSSGPSGNAVPGGGRRATVPPSGDLNPSPQPGGGV
jgi:cell division protease FtsH